MLTKHTKVVALLSLLLLVSTVLVLVGLLYVVSSAKEKFAARQIEVAEAHMHQRELASLVRLVEESAPEREMLASYMLHEEEVIDLLSLLEQIASEQGVSLEISSLDVSEIDDMFERLQIQVTTKGSYEGVLHVLKLLESLPYQSYVSAASISKESDGGLWNSRVTLYVVKYKEGVSI